MEEQRNQGYDYQVKPQEEMQNPAPRRRRSDRYAQLEENVQEIAPEVIQAQSVENSVRPGRNTGKAENVDQWQLKLPERETRAQVFPTGSDSVLKESKASGSYQNMPELGMPYQRSAQVNDNNGMVRIQAKPVSDNMKAVERRKKRPIWLWVLCALVVVIAAGAVILHFTRPGDSTETIALQASSNQMKETASEVPQNQISQKVEQPEKKLWNGREVKQGDTIFFGAYEQDNDQENGKESIEWTVLKVNSDSMLMLSKYALYASKFGPQNNLSAEKWDNSIIRDWLNDEFFYDAFSMDERQDVLSTNVKTTNGKSDNYMGGRLYDIDTFDNAYLLSEDEVKWYFPDDNQRICTLTEYARVMTGATVDEQGNVTWWLRSDDQLSSINRGVSIVGTEGDIYPKSAIGANRGIRPVICVMLDNHELKDKGTAKVDREDGSTVYQRGRYTYEIMEDGNARIVDYNADDQRNLILPDEIDGYKITIIGENAFHGWLERLGIPDSIIKFENGAFMRCGFLEEIIINEGAQYIGDYAFANGSFQKIRIPESVTHIGANPFRNCNRLREIEVAEGNKNYYTYDNALYAKEDNRLICYPPNPAHAALEFAKDVKIIGDAAFYKYSIKKDNIALPESVIHIGKQAFTGCENVTAVTLPAGLQTMADDAFSNCGIEVLYILSDSKVFKADGFAVYNTAEHKLMWFDRTGNRQLSFVKEYEISPDTVAISDFAFQNVETVGKVIIPEGIEEIKDRAFYQARVTEVVLPSTIRTIGIEAFYGCQYMERINFPDELASIGDQAFYRCKKLLEINLPSSIQSIGDAAFYNCYRLQNITLPGSVHEIGEEIFAYCELLSDVTIEEGIQSIPKGMFDYCDKLETIRFPQSVKEIIEFDPGEAEDFCAIVPKDSYAEQYCRERQIHYQYEDAAKQAESAGANELGQENGNLDDEQTADKNRPVPFTVAVGTSVQKEDLYEYQLDQNGYAQIVKYLGNEEVVKVPPTIAGHAVISIGEYAFQNIQAMKRVIVPESVLEIKQNAFVSCPELVYAVIHYDTYLIESLAFVDCQKVNLAGMKHSATETYCEDNGLPFADLYYSYGRKTENGNNAIFSWEILLDDTIEITSCSSSDFENEWAVIPESIDGRKVTALANHTFHDYQISGVTFPENIVYIGDVFPLNYGIKELVLPSKLKYIKKSLMVNCRGLQKITFGNEIERIEELAFSGLEYLEITGLPVSLKYIGESAFHGCRLNLEKLPEGITEIGAQAFSGCKLLQDLYLPRSLQTIGSSAFSGAWDGWIHVPASVTEILGTEAFWNANVYVEKGSYAEQYCIENEVNFKYEK